MASPFESWLQAQKKPKKEVHWPEGMFQDRASSEKANYKWETENLKSLPRSYGRSYNDKFNSIMHGMGVKDPNEIKDFRRWLDAKEYNVSDPVATHQQKENTFMKELFSNMDKRQERRNAPVVVEKKGTKQNSLLEDFTTPLKRFKQALNPFDDVSIKEAIKGNVKDAMTTKRSPITQEMNRTGAQFANAAFTDSLRNTFQRGGGDPNKDFFNERKGVGKVVDTVNNIGGSLLPFGGLYKGVRATGLGLKEGAKGIQKLRQLGQEGALAGLGFSGAQAGLGYAINPKNQDGKETLKNIGLNTALGAIGDPALHGLGKLAGHVISRLKSGKSVAEIATELDIPEEQVQQILALPAPQLRLPGPKVNNDFDSFLKAFKKPTAPGSPAPKFPELLKVPYRIGQLEKNNIHFGYQGKFEPKTRPTVAEQTPNKYWQRQLEDFNRWIDKNKYDRNRLTKESAEDLWSQFAKYEDSIPLEKAIDLAYTGAKGRPSVKQYDQPITPRQANLKDTLHQDKKITDLTKQFFPPRQKISRPATLQEMVDRLQKSAVPAKPKPLEFPYSVKKTVIKGIKPLEKLSLEPKGLDKLKKANLESAKIQPMNKLQKLKPNSGLNKTGLTERLKQVGISPKSLNKGDTASRNTNFGNLKDISGFQAYSTDVYRNTKDVFGDNFHVVKQNLLDPFDKAKGEYVDIQKEWTDKLHKEVVKGLGIAKGSKLSKLVQDYGEGTLKDGEFKSLPKVEQEKIIKADKWFRAAYDELIDKVNAIRVQIHPNNPDKKVPKLDNYYRHFRELNGFEGIQNLFDTPAGIDPQLVGTSDFTTPKTKFAGFMQKRGLGKYKSDAVGGFLNYLPAASYSIKIDPHIKNFREFEKILKNATPKGNLNTYIEFVHDFANDLAGKTNPFDRGPQKILGRKAFNFLSAINNRVKKNVILGNIGSVLAQVGNVPNGIAFAKQYSAPGAVQTLRSVIKKGPSSDSIFLKERFGHEMYQKFDTKWIEQPEKLASWLMTFSDKVGTSFVWNSAYAKGISKKVTNPIKYADDETRKLVAGRGIGEVPLVQKSKIFQLIAPFQLEVANLWKVQKDFVKEKDFGALMTLYTTSWVLNKAMESVRGSGVTFDPLEAIVDAYNEDDLTTLERGGRLAGEVLSNVPLGQTLANFYPEYGTKNLPTRQQLFGDKDPNRFGSGLMVAKGVQDPLYKLAPPFGGNQLQKLFGGLEALKKEGVYSRDGSRLKYPVSNDLGNRLKGSLFGPGALKETRDYYDNKRTPLGVNQTKEFKDLKQQGTEKQYYNSVVKKREQDKLMRLINSLKKDKTTSDVEKKNKLEDLFKKLQKVKQTN